MPWRAWVATLNTQHGEDDIGLWVSPGGDYGVALVADGVSATGGGGASYLAASAAVLACRVHLPYGVSFSAMKRCLSYISRAAEAGKMGDAALVEALKKRYYAECSRGGEPCTRPLSVEDAMRLGPVAPEETGEGRPSSTLLAAVFGGSLVGFMLLGDGVAMSTGARDTREELWVAWGALPQYYEGVRVVRYVELGGGARGHPVLLLAESEPGRVYVVATDGVDPAALAEALNALAPRIEEVAASSNPAAELLKDVRARVGGFEDDASVAVVYHAPSS